MLSDNSKKDDLESLWDAILSRKADLILQMFNSLDLSERQAILVHLKRMVSEKGWHPEQQASAREALEVLEVQNNKLIAK